MWVAEVEPERRTVVKAHSSGTGDTTALLTPAGEGADLTMVFCAETGSSLLLKIMMKVFGGIGITTTKAMTQDLRDIATRARTADWDRRCLRIP